MFNPSANGALKSTAHKRAVAEVTRWVTEAITNRNIFAVDQFQVMVTEIQCNEPDCVPIETLVVVVLMDSTDDTSASTKGARKWANKIMMPVAEVTSADVDALMIEMFPINNENVDKISEGKARIKLFGDELIALINKYQTPESTEDATSYKLLFVETLQGQIDILRRDITKAENPIPITPLPVPEPARAVTMVIMKPNISKNTSPPSSAAPVDAAPNSLPNANPISTLSNFPSTVPDAASVLSIPPPTAVKMTAKSVNTATAVNHTQSDPITKAAVVESNATGALPTHEAASSSTPGGNTTDAPLVAEKVTSVPITKAPAPLITYSQPAPTAGATIAPRHKKGGTRPRGCPCCDPDNLDNIIDTMMFSHYPQT